MHVYWKDTRYIYFVQLRSGFWHKHAFYFWKFVITIIIFVHLKFLWETMHNEKDILACSWVFLKAQGHLVFVLLKRKKKQWMVVDRCHLLETKSTKTFWTSFIWSPFWHRRLRKESLINQNSKIKMLTMGWEVPRFRDIMRFIM